MSKKPNQEPKRETYSVPGHCHNCDHSGTLTLPKGVRAGGCHCCPLCGCNTFAARSPYKVFRDPPLPWGWTGHNHAVVKPAAERFRLYGSRADLYLSVR